MFPSYNTNKLIYKAVLQGFFGFFFPFHSKQSRVFFFLPLSGLQGPQTCAAAAATNSKTAVILLSRSKTRLNEKLRFHCQKQCEVIAGVEDRLLPLPSPVKG